MRSLTLVPGFRIAAFVLLLSAGRALAGFADLQEASGASLPLTENATANTDENDSTLALTFDVNEDDQPVKDDEVSQQIQTDVQTIQAPVAAPLPVALLPGGVMIAGSFIATRVFKRRIV